MCWFQMNGGSPEYAVGMSGETCTQDVLEGLLCSVTGRTGKVSILSSVAVFLLHSQTGLSQGFLVDT